MPRANAEGERKLSARGLPVASDSRYRVVVDASPNHRSGTGAVPAAPVLAEATRVALLRRGRGARFAWLCLGLVLVAIGFIGIFVPLLPTTDFLILALPCFARSSPRLEASLLGHPRFGPALQAWQQHGAVPRHAKIASCAGMAIGFAAFCWGVRPSVPVVLAIAAVLAACAAWILRRPSRAPVPGPAAGR